MHRRATYRGEVKGRAWADRRVGNKRTGGRRLADYSLSAARGTGAPGERESPPLVPQSVPRSHVATVDNTGREARMRLSSQ